MGKMIKESIKKILIFTSISGLVIILFGCRQNPADVTGMTATATKKPEWLKEPVVLKGSNQEPLIFQLRRGSVSARTEENYLYTHSAENVKKIKE